MDARAGEGWFRSLLDTAPAMIWMSGTDAKCTYFNRAWLAYTGRSLAQEVGDGWAEGVHPEDLDECVKRYLDHFERRAPFRMEYRLRRADGSFGWILDDGAPRYAEDGSFLGFVGSCVDVTQQKEAMRLARSQGVARALASRLVHEIVERASVDPNVLRDVGRALARERPRGDLAAYAETFRDMGFGQLTFAGARDGRSTFLGSDLIERRTTASLPTCALTLGYLEGAVQAATRRPVLGTETRCQSQGHPTCEFVVAAH